MFGHLSGADGGDNAQNNIVVERFQVFCFTARMSTDQVKVVRYNRAIIPDHQDDMDALGLGLHQTLQGQDRAATVALLEEHAMGLGRQTGEVIVRWVRWFLCQRGPEMIQQVLEFFRRHVYQRVEGSGATQVEATASSEQQSLAPPNRFAKGGGG